MRSSVDSKYSEAVTKAANAFLIQSGTGSAIDNAENALITTATRKAYNAMGHEAAVLVGTAAFVAKCVRDNRVTTRFSNPILDQKNRISIGTNGAEISEVRSFMNTSHWFRLESARGGAVYSTGFNLSF